MFKTVAEIAAERMNAEDRARERAALLPPGEYHAYNEFVTDSASRAPVLETESHWDACLVLLALGGSL